MFLVVKHVVVVDEIFAWVACWRGVIFGETLLAKSSFKIFILTTGRQIYSFKIFILEYSQQDDTRSSKSSYSHQDDTRDASRTH